MGRSFGKEYLPSVQVEASSMEFNFDFTDPNREWLSVLNMLFPSDPEMISSTIEDVGPVEHMVWKWQHQGDNYFNHILTIEKEQIEGNPDRYNMIYEAFAEKDERKLTLSNLTSVSINLGAGAAEFLVGEDESVTVPVLRPILYYI